MCNYFDVQLLTNSETFFFSIIFFSSELGQIRNNLVVQFYVKQMDKTIKDKARPLPPLIIFCLCSYSLLPHIIFIVSRFINLAIHWIIILTIYLFFLFISLFLAFPDTLFNLLTFSFVYKKHIILIFFLSWSSAPHLSLSSVTKACTSQCCQTLINERVGPGRQVLTLSAATVLFDWHLVPAATTIIFFPVLFVCERVRGFRMH